MFVLTCYILPYSMTTICCSDPVYHIPATNLAIVHHIAGYSACRTLNFMVILFSRFSVKLLHYLTIHYSKPAVSVFSLEM